MVNHTPEPASGAARPGTRGVARPLLRLAWFPVALGWAASLAVAAEPNYVTVRTETVADRIEAYGQAEPMAVVSVQATTPGIVSELAVMPGATVQRGQRLGELSGPELEATLARARAAFASAQAKVAAAEKALSVARQQRVSHLATQQQVLEAESAVADASGAFHTAKAELASAEQTASLTAATDGTVLTTNVAAGQRVAGGDTILTLAPTATLAVKAAVYGADADLVRVGMKGTFTATQPNASIPVVVLAAAPSPQGGETVWLRPDSSTAALRTGTFGSVVLTGPARSLVAVPTRALILDQGRWWVLVHTTKGEEPRAVEPGPSRGWETFLEHGLEPGAQVVVDNAYLEFHRDISQKYQSPD